MEFFTALGRLSTADVEFTDFFLFARLLGRGRDSVLPAYRRDRGFVAASTATAVGDEPLE
jgi:hypothetical protein